ncbi:MAG: CPBP family intramembrane metalloprotease [Dethiosulfatibacter sp.]|nr:CPBP family intramembrane metalloprotease [Dethiosulfatibacter sp.]
MKRILILILALIITFIIPYGFAKAISDLYAKSFSDGGAAGFFILTFIHRLAQFIITTILFALIFNRFDINMGFSFDDIVNQLKLFKSVVIMWPILTIVFFLFTTIFVDGFIDYLSNLYPLETGWVLAKVGRDVLLLDALAEEVLNRAFIIQLIAIYWSNRFRLGSWSISHAALLSVPLFVLSHIQVELFPFSIKGYDPIQLGLTFFTGLLFAYAYERTKGLLVPIFLHGYTNFTITVVAYLTLAIV